MGSGRAAQCLLLFLPFVPGLMLGTEDRGIRQSHAHGSPDGRGTRVVATVEA